MTENTVRTYDSEEVQVLPTRPGHPLAPDRLAAKDSMDEDNAHPRAGSGPRLGG